MPVSFENLIVGTEYDRPQLAKIWGYKGFQAISRGVVTPGNTKYIILFVTEEKQESLTQYNDFLVGSRLHWEGEKKHGSDSRIISANFGPDQIHLFHRKRHHSPFTYFGRIYLEQHHLREDAPSQFIFYLSVKSGIGEDEASYLLNSEYNDSDPKRTEKAAIRSSRIGQGVFRDGLFRIWGSCAVTGYERPRLLIASHIKPWKVSNDLERLDPFNGLLLQPTLDKLFDLGLVSFRDNGELLRANTIRSDELGKLGMNPQLKLREVFVETREYLEYHRDMEFEKYEDDA